MTYKAFCTRVQYDAETNDIGLMEIVDSIVQVHTYPPMPSTAEDPDATLFEPDAKLARKYMVWENDRTHVVSQLQT